MTTHTNGTTAAFNGSYAAAAPPMAPTLPPESPTIVGPARSAAASRRTSRRALIISVLVVLVGGVIAFAGAQALTKHTQVLAIAQDVPIGGSITDADLSVASVTKDPNLAPIPASDRSQVVGMIAQVALVKGELLTRAQIGTSTGFTTGQLLVALSLKSGQFPARGLSPGQSVLIVATPGANAAAPVSGSADGSSGSGSGSASAATQESGIAATVTDVGSMNQATQLTVIDVRVNSSDGVSVARLASTGNVAIILLPPGR